MPKKLKAPHPGKILQKEFLEPLKLTQYRLSKDINVPPIRISEIIHGKRRISADTALRFARFFGTTAKFWLNLQTHYDLEIEEEKLKHKIKYEVKILNSDTIKNLQPTS